jgi:hypothetical protein
MYPLMLDLCRVCGHWCVTLLALLVANRRSHTGDDFFDANVVATANAPIGELLGYMAGIKTRRLKTLQLPPNRLFEMNDGDFEAYLVLIEKLCVPWPLRDEDGARQRRRISRLPELEPPRLHSVGSFGFASSARSIPQLR